MCLLAIFVFVVSCYIFWNGMKLTLTICFSMQIWKFISINEKKFTFIQHKFLFRPRYRNIDVDWQINSEKNASNHYQSCVQLLTTSHNCLHSVNFSFIPIERSEKPVFNIWPNPMFSLSRSRCTHAPKH